MKNSPLDIHPIENSQDQPLPLFLSPVHAGFPSPADDFIEESINLNKELIAHPAATFFVRVAGDSMVDANIHKNDVLIVDRSIVPSDGKIIIAIINGEFTVKQMRIKNNKTFLQPKNPSYPLIEIHPDCDFQVWGVVTYIIHKAL